MKSKNFTALMIRLALGLIYITAGFSKLVPEYLGNIIGPVDSSMISDSQSIQVLFIFAAVYQIVAGALLLSQRYALFGYVLLFPMSLGILIFTIVAGFGGTPFINLFLLLLLTYVIIQEKKAVLQLLKGNFRAYQQTTVFELYPSKRIPNAGLVIVFTTMCLWFVINELLNVLCSVALFLFALNLFQVKSYLLIDKILIVLFLIIGLIIINGLVLNQFIDRGFIIVFPLILLGILLYVFRLMYWRFWNKNK